MMRKPRIPLSAALWAPLLMLALAWLMTDTLWPQPFNYFAFRGVAVQFTGIIAIGAMSLALWLAVRPRWLEPYLNGLDKMYRLHKWLGITALVASLAHWWLAQGTKWMVGWGWLQRPVRGPRPALDPHTLEGWLRSMRGLAEDMGEWAFYGALALMVLALIKRFPYRWFAKTHQVLALAYLVLVFHALVLVRFSYWQQPIGWLVAALLALGTVAALLVLTGRTAASRKTRGQIVAVRHFAPLATLRTAISVPGWPGHAAGQFAFVQSVPGEPPHPYTIASAWDAARRELVFVTKALGDHTRRLPDVLRPGLPVTVEGPYGRFTFDDGEAAAARRQIWVGGGIGITPFLARLHQLALDRQAGKPVQPVHLFHSTREVDEDALAQLARDAEAAGVTLTVLVSGRDGLLTGERIRTAVPEWREASFWFCGPAGFGRALRDDFTAQGYPVARFHQEMFEMR